MTSPLQIQDKAMGYRKPATGSLSAYYGIIKDVIRHPFSHMYS